MKKDFIYEMLLILVGCIIYAVSMVIVDPIELIPGSFLGVAVILHKLVGTQTGMVNLILNIPIMLLCFKVFGQKMLYYTILIMIATSSLIDLFMAFAPGNVSLPPLILAVSGGIVMGVGAGLLLIAGGTMAGTTALARILQSRCEKITVGNALIIMDSAIILAGSILLHSWIALLYSILYTVFCSKTIDLVYYVNDRIKKKSTKN